MGYGSRKNRLSNFKNTSTDSGNSSSLMKKSYNSSGFDSILENSKLEQSQDKSHNKSCADLTADFESDYVKFSDIIKLQNQLMKSSKFIKKEDPMKYYERTGQDCNIGI